MDNSVGIYFADLVYRKKSTNELMMRMSHHSIAVLADSSAVAEVLIDTAIKKENEKLPSMFYTEMYITRGEVKKCDYMIFSSHEDWSTLYYKTFVDS